MKNLQGFQFTGIGHKIAGIVVVCILLAGCSKNAFYHPRSIQEEMDKAVESGVDGMIVYVNQAGHTSLYSAGFNNRENLTPADPQSLFKIASISKLYIAAATTKLIANQSLSLNSTLQELIPETSGRIEHADEITLRMLLQHRSGIPEFINLSAFENSDPEEDYMTTAALIFDQSADFKPDKKYRYSNTNYLLIGEILDRKLGYSHHDYISSEILDPLGLADTYNLYGDANPDEVMSGYYKGYDSDLKSAEYTRPGGSMVASIEDVGIFLRALIDGTLLSEDEQTIYSSIYEYEHTGWLPGYCSIARYSSDVDAIVIQFVNTSHGELFWLELNGVYNRIVKVVERWDVEH